MDTKASTNTTKQLWHII